MASSDVSLGATFTPGSGESLKKRTGHLFPPSSDDRCTARVFLAATGIAERCRYRRRRETFCSRHFRDRFDPTTEESRETPSGSPDRALAGQRGGTRICS